jgi:hypothetical protein
MQTKNVQALLSGYESNLGRRELPVVSEEIESKST